MYLRLDDAIYSVCTRYVLRTYYIYSKLTLTSTEYTSKRYQAMPCHAPSHVLSYMTHRPPRPGLHISIISRFGHIMQATLLSTLARCLTEYATEQVCSSHIPLVPEIEVKSSQAKRRQDKMEIGSADRNGDCT
jgi:hypothetical protein